MSDTSESDDGSANWNRRRGKKKREKIVMRIEFDDSDETSGCGSDSSDGDIRPCSSTRRNRGGKRLLTSDEDRNNTSSGSEIARTVVVRGRRMKKAVIAEEEQPDEPCTSAAIRSDLSTAGRRPEDEGSASDSSNDDTLEKCPICLLSLRNQEVGNPSTCDHQFCVICIEEWAKNVTTCPIDRRAFDSIIVHESFSNRKFVRKIKITPQKDPESAEFTEDGTTFCQVCNLSNREDVMLLCDGCNQGYHMDCLNPPLIEIPEGFWYCDCCFESEDEDVQEDLNLLFEDLREMGVPETRLRIREVRQPRIPRTRQSERIRASIMARTRTSRTRRFTEMDVSPAVSSSHVTTTTRTRTTTSRTRTTTSETSTTTARTSTTTATTTSTRRRNKKRRKRRSQRKRRTYVVEYDVDNFDQKFEIKTTKKVIRKRKKRSGHRRHGKATSTAGLSSRRQTSQMKDFLALQASQPSTSDIVRPSFSLFGDPNSLEYFTDESDSNMQNGENDEIGLGSGGGAAVQTSIRIHSFGPGSSLNRRKGIIRDLDLPRQVDVLSSIMDLQDRFHNATRQNHIASVRIGPDGSLNLPDKDITPSKTTKSNTGTGNRSVIIPEKEKLSNTSKKSDRGTANGSVNLPDKEDSSNKPTKSDTPRETQIPPENINQAPMYPRGGNNNYSNSGGGGGGGSYNNRFNSQSNYRNSTGSTGGGQFRGNSNSTGGASGSGNFLFNSFRRDNNNSFQSDNSFQSAHNNNSDNSSPNLRGRFRPNLNQQRRNFGRFSGPPPLLQHNENLNRSLSNSFNSSSININPSTSSGLQPPQQFTPTKLSETATLLGLPPTSNLRSYSGPISNSNLISVTLQPRPELPTYGPPNLPPNLPMYGPPNLPVYGPPNLPVYGPDLITVPVLPSPELPVYGPVNYSGPDPPPHTEEPQNAASIPMPPLAPPLAPPPWNKNLFRLTSDYADGDDDDDDDCPNFSVYSAESFQVARSSENTDQLSAPATATQKQTSDSEKAQQEDEFEEREEDLVQLGDDDEIPDAIDKGAKNKNTSESEIYEPDNPTEEPDQCDSDEGEDDDDDNEESHTPEQKKRGESDDEESEENGNDSSLGVSQNQSIGKVENDDDEDEDSEATQDKKLAERKKSSRNKKGVLELYDDSDWEEWNIEKTELIPMPPDRQEENDDDPDKREGGTPEDEEIKTPELVRKKQTESLSDEDEDEEERSYTPCLDEKTDHDDINNESAQRAKSKSKSVERNKAEAERTDVCTAVIDGIETELISDEDAEILNEDQNKAGGSSTKKDDKGKNDASGRRRKEQFKKISKSTKERNYRDKDNRVRSRKRSKSRTRSRSNDKENQHGRRTNRRRNNKRKDIERYDVRNVIGQPRTFKDRYGRDTSRPARSKSKSRTPLPRRPRTKSRTRSVSSKNIRRSFSMSPTPISIGRPSPRRRMFSPRRSRSRRRSRSFRRSPIIRRRTRTPLRLRSRSNSGVRQNGRRIQRLRRRTLSRSLSRSRTPRAPTPRKSRSRSFSRQRNKKRLKDRKKKRIKKRPASTSLTPPPPAKRIQRTTERVGGTRKKKVRPRTKTPVLERTWSQSPEPAAVPVGNESSWTPPLVGTNSNNITVILKNKELAAANKRKREKKKRNEQRRRDGIRKEKRKRRSEIRESPIAPSKEVFASGDNILVSVSFNKDGNMGAQQQTTVVTLPPTREEIVSKRRSPERPNKKQKKSKEKSQRRHKKTDAKPVAIIDLDRSPFQVIAQSPRDVIILTDSDREEEEDEDEMNKRKTNNNNSEVEPNEDMANDLQLDSIDKSPHVERPATMEEESFEMQQLGPKTPPEPPTIKFAIVKAKQVKVRNPLHDEQEELENEQVEEENDAGSDIEAANKIGPNTPPESGPCSPDAYDPFDPTKSPSPSPSHSPPQQADIPADTAEKESNVTENNTVEPRTTSLSQSQEKNMNPVDLVMALMTSKTNKSQEMLNLSSESASYNIPSKSDASESLEINDENLTGVPKNITVLSNVLITSGKSQQRSAPILTTSPPVSKSQSQNLTKLPMPKLIVSNRQNGGTGGSSEDIGGGMIEIESPYSPGADDYEDLFEPPVDNIISLSQLARNRAAKTKSNKTEIFDNLFGSTSPVAQMRMPNYRKKSGNKPTNKKAPIKVTKNKLDDDQIKIFDELPSSAVELQVKDKFLRKLNRQERVVEEVKLVLKPHYNRKKITKDDYKDILRRAVPKICHSRSGEINPNKIKKLIEAYVRKFRQRNKFGIIGTRQVSSASKCAAYLNKL